MRKPKRPDTYHHGSLRKALLQAAERILERDGIQGLTLRAAAREAGGRTRHPRITSAIFRVVAVALTLNRTGAAKSSMCYFFATIME